MTVPQTIILDRCSQAGNYRGDLFPTCGCHTCWDIWHAKASMTPEDFGVFLLDVDLAWTKFAASVK